MSKIKNWINQIMEGYTFWMILLRGLICVIAFGLFMIVAGFLAILLIHAIVYIWFWLQWVLLGIFILGFLLLTGLTFTKK